jgi:hypothetical protein
MKQPVAGNSKKMAAIITRVARTFGAGAGFISVNLQLCARLFALSFR